MSYMNFVRINILQNALTSVQNSIFLNESNVHISQLQFPFSTADILQDMFFSINHIVGSTGNKL